VAEFLNGDWIGIGIGVLWVVVFGSYGCRSYNATSTCLAAGYPEAKVLMLGGSYCVKRVEQTDVVVPLSEVKR
jgi:hypothetical protein